MVLRTVRFTLIVLLCAAALAAVAAGPAAASTTGAGHWTWQSPLPNGSWISGTSFIDADEGWEVTGDGDVLHTTDGGVTWDTQPTGENDALYGVLFTSATDGWVVGDWGCVLHTADGGATWERQVSGTLDSLSDIVFVDDDHGWIVGDNSILATTDGGATWALQLGGAVLSDWWDYYYGPETYFAAGAFVDAQHGCVVGTKALHRQEEDSTGAAWFTADGGATWTETDVPNVTGLMAVTTQGGTYFAAGAGNAIAHSDDGLVWTRDTVSAPVYLYDIAMTAGGAGWAVGTGDSSDWFSDSNVTVGIALHTTDGGATWEPVADPVLSLDSLDSVTFDGPNDGRIVGESGSIYVTDDGGATWAAVGPERKPPVSFSAIAEAPDGLLWVVGSAGTEYYDEGDGDGVVWRSSDGGATWDKLDDPLLAVAGLTEVCAAAGGEAWVAGEGGRILHTTDGGVTWKQQATGIAASLLGLSFSDSEHGWAVSASLPGAVLKTSDGGAHWAVVAVGTRERYMSVQARGTDVWLGGMAYRSDCTEEGGGIVAHSTDSGVNWTTVDTSKRAVIDATFPGGGEGWALSGIPYWYDSADTLLHTTDGGATWAEVTVGPSRYVRGFGAMFFLDADEGWVLAGSSGDGQLLLHTIDGGAHWGAVPMDDTWGLQAIYFSGHDDGWMAGSGSTILATTDGGGMAPFTVSNTSWGAKWTRTAFKLRLTTVDDGYGLATTQTRLGDGPWEDLASRVIAAPKNHSNDGYHLIRYRGVDLDGNREEARSALVAVDTRRPRLAVHSRSAARPMKRASLRLKANDSFSPGVRVTADVFSQGGQRVRRLRGSLPTDDRWHAIHYYCTMPVGTYRIVVQVSDYAGNKAATARTVILRVKR